MPRRGVFVAALLAALGMGHAVPPTAPAAPPDVIRVGGPSAPTDPKHAIVASRRNLAGRPYTVVDSAGATVLSGTLVRAPGSARPWRNAAAADLSALTTPGTYTVRVGSLRSRRWLVTPDAAGRAIGALLNFFASNSDGREPSPAHGPSHLRDAVVRTGKYRGRKYDLTGGWMDAGDTLKFANTTGHAVALLEASARLAPGHAAALQRASDVGVRWLMKLHPEPDLFIAQVGDVRDHEDFRNPANDDRSRRPGIGQRLADPRIGADTAGKVATGLAMAALRGAAPGREAIAAQAIAWYAEGKRLQRTAKLPDGFYTSGSWKDDMAAAAVALARLTGSPELVGDALGYLSDADANATFGWDSFELFAAADLCGALGAPAVAGASDRGCSLLSQAAAASRRLALRGAFGFAASYNCFGCTPDNAGRGALAALAARAGLAPEGRIIAAGARDNQFGRNQWGASFVVGFGHSPARHPHHWASLRGAGRPRGAVVGGPTTPRTLRQQRLRISPRSRLRRFNSSTAVYEDNVNNYVTSEPALDYTAATIFLVAALAG